MTENISTQRTDYADEALSAYLALPVNESYDGETDTVAETDAFVAGWEASITHLNSVLSDMDIPGPLKSIVTQILESNRAEYSVND